MLEIKNYFKLLVVISVLIQLCASADYLLKKPAFFKTCKLADPNSPKCVSDNLITLLQKLAAGEFTGHHITNVDPFKLNKVTVKEQSNRVFTADLVLTNFELRGMSKIQVVNASIDPETLTFKYKILLPKLRLDTDYKVNGRVLVMPINSQGTGFFEADDLEIDIIVKTKVYKNYGKKFFKTAGSKLDYKVGGGVRVRVNNLFNGNKNLEDSTNQLFNENWREFNEVLKPIMTSVTDKIALELLKGGFNFIPAEYLIGDLPDE